MAQDLDVDEDFAEPWRCCVCRLLIYNLIWVRETSYPIPGAPEAHFINSKYPRVCSACHTLWEVAAESAHVKHAQERYNLERRRRGQR